uniref:Zinc knuckle CX2CX4HX4C domain-containing protein n=1 Tax=Chenopodium quinoa TaxID=63459 RepID=A0A803LY53_CHEQI
MCKWKVEIDVPKPLRRGVFVAGGGSKSKWVDIKYERLQIFCFFCGRLNHTDKECQVREIEGEQVGAVVYQYGTWLRASPMKMPLKSFAVREKERIWGDKLGSIRGEGSSSSNFVKRIKLAPVGVARKLHFASRKEQ